jgi:serine O-acetyltransferase
MFENLRADISRARSATIALEESGWRAVARRSLTPFRLTMWPIFSYRFAHVAHRVRVPVARQFLLFAAVLFERWTQLWTKVYIHREACIGPGLLIRSPYAVLIGIATIGRNCTVETGNVIGGSIGDNVCFGPGAKMIGDPRIGNNVVVAGNSLVLANVHDGATVTGVPARMRLSSGATAV